MRESFLYSYRLVYELIDEEIHILAVIHGKRLLESLERFNREASSTAPATQGVSGLSVTMLAYRSMK